MTDWRAKSPCGSEVSEAHRHVAHLLIALRAILDIYESEERSRDEMLGLAAQASEALHAYFLYANSDELVVRFWRSDVIVDALGLRAASWVHEHIAPLVERLVLAGWESLIVSKTAEPDDFVSLGAQISDSGLDIAESVREGGLWLKKRVGFQAGGSFWESLSDHSDNASGSTFAFLMQCVMQADEDLHSRRDSFCLNLTDAAARVVDWQVARPSILAGLKVARLMGDPYARAIAEALVAVSCAARFWDDRAVLRHVASASLINSLAPVDDRGTFRSRMNNDVRTSAPPLTGDEAAALMSKLVLAVPGAAARMPVDIWLAEKVIRFRFGEPVGEISRSISLLAAIVALPSVLVRFLVEEDWSWDSAIALLAERMSDSVGTIALRAFLATAAALPAGTAVSVVDGEPALVVGEFAEGNLSELNVKLILDEESGEASESLVLPGREITSLDAIAGHSVAVPSELLRSESVRSSTPASRARSSHPPATARTSSPPRQSDEKLELDLDDVFGS